MNNKGFVLPVAIIAVAVIIGSIFAYDIIKTQPDEVLGDVRVLTVPQGGTGQSSFTAGECIVGNGTGALTSQSCSTGTGGGSNWLVNASGQLTPSTTIDVLLPANATSSHLAVTEMCIGSDCKTSWPAAGAASWDDLTNKPATSTVLNLLDTENRIEVLNATTTNVGTLTVYSGATLSSATTTDSLSVGKLALGGVYASVYDGSAACATGAICTGGHTHVGVNETYGSGWNGDTATPEKDDIYDYLHQMDTDDDGDIDTLNSSVLNLLNSDSRIAVINATTSNVDTLCIQGDCKTAWPSAGTGVSDWNYFDATTIKPTSTVGMFINASSTFNSTLRVNGATTLIALANCDTIDTDANGLLSCGTDADSWAGTGSNWNYFDATTIKPTSTVGFFIPASSTINSSLRVTGALTAPGGITGALTGNASTASALAADPSDCAAGTAATAIGTNGNLTCSITPLVSGGTLNSSNVCQYDGTGLDCDLTKDGSGDCASGSVCLGDHTHSTYATLANPTFTGLQVLPDARIAMINSTTTNIDTLTIYTGSTFPANDIVDAEVSDTLTASNLVASGSVVADAEVDDSITINTALQGIFSGDLRVATFNATTTKTDNLTVNTTLSLPANAVTDAMVSDTLTCSDLQAASAVVADSEVVDALTISTSAEGIFTGNIRTNAINATTTKTDNLTVYGNSTMAAVTTTNLAVSGLLNCDTIDTDASGSFKCGTDASTAGSAGSNWDYFDATTLKPTTTVGFFISASSTINSTLRVTGALTAPGGITGALTGNASTASALSADPDDCAAGTVATAIAANGNLTCSITPLISGGTLTSANVCQYDGTGIDCNLVKDSSGDCASGAVCLGDHTHSTYATLANPTFTGLQVAPDLRAAMLNSTTTKVGTLTVFTGSTLSGLSIISDGRLAVINSTTTKADILTVNTSATINAATLNGLSVIADGRIAMLNSTTTKIDNLWGRSATTTESQYIGSGRIWDTQEKCFTLASTTWASVKTDIPLWHPYRAITVVEERGIVIGGTSAVLTLSDGTNNLDALTAGTTLTKDSSLSNNSWVADELMQVDVGTITGAVDYANVCIIYRYN